MKEQKQSALLTVLLISLAACVLYAVASGIRANFGIMINAIVENSGVDYAAVSFVMAVAQLVVGLIQPVSGAVALKKSNSFVLLVGTLMIGAGMLWLPLCHSMPTLMLSLGILLPSGCGALAFGIIMGAITPALGERRAAAASGFVSASAGLGSTIIAPLMQRLIDANGLRAMLLALCVPVALMIPVSLALSRVERRTAAPVAAQDRSLVKLVVGAFQDRSYRFIALAFFTCGFHMCIIETHLYSQYVSWGIADETVALAFSVYGVAAMLGCIFTGFMGSVAPWKAVLGCTYGSRVIIGILLLCLPKSVPLVFATAALLGFTGNATVPPTSALISRRFGSQRLAALFGIAFLLHQVGAFLSSWLGGIFISNGGGYAKIWLVSMALSVLAATLSFLVKDEKLDEGVRD